MYHHRTLPAVLFTTLCMWSVSMAAIAENDKARKFEIDLNADVLVFTEPVREDGTIDYIAALNKHHSEGVTKDNNAFRELYLLMAHTEWDLRWEGDLAWYNPMLREMLEIQEDEIKNGARFIGWEGWDLEHKKEQGHLIEVYDQFLNDPFAEQLDPAMADWLERNEPALVRLGKAVARPKYWSPLVEEDEDGLLMAVLLPQLSEFRTLSRALEARAFRAAVEGDGETVVDSIRSMRLLAYHVSHEPYVISGLVGISIDAMITHTLRRMLEQRMLPDATLAEIHAVLIARPQRNPIAENQIGEKCASMDLFSRMTLDRMDSSNVFGDDGLFSKVDHGGELDYNHALREISREYDRVIAASKPKSFKGRQAVQEEIEQELKDRKKAVSKKLVARLAFDLNFTKRGRTKYLTEMFIVLDLPARTRAFITETRILAKERASRVAIAVERYRLKHDRLPDKLDALVPGFIDAIPPDPFNDELLGYKVLDKGFVVYAVGENLKDDGGMDGQAGEGDTAIEIIYGRTYGD